MDATGFARRAGDGDVEAVTQLEAEMRAAVAATERGGAAWLATHPCLGDTGWHVRLADPGWATVVAGLDGAVLAYASMRLPVGRLRPAAEIECIYVTSGGREVGLGESLLGELLDLATAAGAEEVDATALPGDRETKNMFERAGLVARLIVVNRRLRSEG